MAHCPQCINRRSSCNRQTPNTFSHCLPIHLLQHFDTSHLKQIRPAHVVSINPTRRGYSKYPCKPLFFSSQKTQPLQYPHNCYSQAILALPFDEIDSSRPVERESASATQRLVYLFAGKGKALHVPQKHGPNAIQTPKAIAPQNIWPSSQLFYPSMRLPQCHERHQETGFMVTEQHAAGSTLGL